MLSTIPGLVCAGDPEWQVELAPAPFSKEFAPPAVSHHRWRVFHLIMLPALFIAPVLTVLHPRAPDSSAHVHASSSADLRAALQVREESALTNAQATDEPTVIPRAGPGLFSPPSVIAAEAHMAAVNAIGPRVTAPTRDVPLPPARPFELKPGGLRQPASGDSRAPIDLAALVRR